MSEQTITGFRKVLHFVNFLRWLWWAGIRYRHFSFKCYGELPCDPRSHMTLGAMWTVSGIRYETDANGDEDRR